MNVVTPASESVSTHCTQRTGCVSWNTSSRAIVSASLVADAVSFVTIAIAGARSPTPATASENAATAGCISDVWNAPFTSSGIARFAPRSSANAHAFATASFAPPITICPGELMLHSSAPASPQTAATAPSSSPITAAMPPCVASAAACVSRPRSSTSRTPASKSSAPAAASALYSPRLCPATYAASPPTTPAARAASMQAILIV